MKKFLLVLSLFFFVSTLSAQSNTGGGTSQDGYLLKSKRQKKAGWILLGSGAALIATGALLPRGAYEGIGPCLQLLCDEYKNDEIKGAFILAGTMAMLASVPVFIVSGKNKRKAGAVSLTRGRAVYLYSSKMVRTSFPALTLNIPL